MRRRRFLLGTIALTSLSGCAVGYQGRGILAGGIQDGTDPASDGGLPVSKDNLRAAANRDGIPAITDPAFAPDWSAVSIERDGDTYEPRLRRQELVIGVERSGAARAYPLKVLTWHEVVNDQFGVPMLVTYCPLCRSGLVARREVAGEETIFGVSGYLYHENLVLYDRLTESLWSQIKAQAIHGPRTGEELAVMPSQVTTWKAWRESHPDTRVLLPSPLSDTVVGEVHPPYGIKLYERQAETAEAFGFDGPNAGMLPDRMLVLGIAHDGSARAYPFPDVNTAGVINDRVGDLPVVITLADGELVAYVRQIDGQTLEFVASPFQGGGSRFDPVTGRALDGPFDGRRLEQVPGARTMFWFAWKAFHPDTDVFRQ